jgi:predicted transcriptional regulator of viral defense system
MNWESFLKKAQKTPVIYTENLYAGNHDVSSIEVQLSRWKKSGKIIQLKKGVYVISEPYRKTDIYEPHLASVLTEPSYLSMEKAMEFHNLIPEAVYVYTSITTKRPKTFETKLGVFSYNHIKTSLFWGYNSVTFNKQTAFIACPEKALLDFFYFKTANINMAYINELRLQNLDTVNVKKLMGYAKKFQKPKILRAAELVSKHIDLTLKEEKQL